MDAYFGIYHSGIKSVNETDKCFIKTIKVGGIKS